MYGTLFPWVHGMAKLWLQVDYMEHEDFCCQAIVRALLLFLFTRGFSCWGRRQKAPELEWTRIRVSV